MEKENRVLKIGHIFYPQYLVKCNPFWLIFKDYYRNYKFADWDDYSGYYSRDLSFATIDEAWMFIDNENKKSIREVFYRNESEK